MKFSLLAVAATLSAVSAFTTVSLILIKIATTTTTTTTTVLFGFYVCLDRK
jgi:hypothetical protein